MKKLVIVGGGFTGSFIAKKLENKFNVVLIDTKPYFEFTPGILRTIVEPEHVRKIQVLHEHYLRKSELVIGCVKDVGKNYVSVDGKKIKFDYLVIASGSRYQIPIKEQNVVMATRASHLKKHYEKLCSAENVLIIGGGIVGVELAAEIATHYKDKNITLVHPYERLMPRNHSYAAKYAKKFLEANGVKIVLDDRVDKVLPDEAITRKGMKIKSDLVFVCTGIKPNYEFMKKNFSSKIENGNLRVNEYLQLEGADNIFVGGDVAGIKEEKTAQNAECHAEMIIHNLCALDKSEKMKEYKTGKRIMVISLGKWKGVVEYGRFAFAGLIGGILKAIVEKREMIRKKKLM